MLVSTPWDLHTVHGFGMISRQQFLKNVESIVHKIVNYDTNKTRSSLCI